MTNTNFTTEEFKAAIQAFSKDYKSLDSLTLLKTGIHEKIFASEEWKTIMVTITESFLRIVKQGEPQHLSFIANAEVAWILGMLTAFYISENKSQANEENKDYSNIPKSFTDILIMPKNTEVV